MAENEHGFLHILLHAVEEMGESAAGMAIVQMLLSALGKSGGDLKLPPGIERLSEPLQEKFLQMSAPFAVKMRDQEAQWALLMHELSEEQRLSIGRILQRVQKNQRADFVLTAVKEVKPTGDKEKDAQNWAATVDDLKNIADEADPEKQFELAVASNYFKRHEEDYVSGWVGEHIKTWFADAQEEFQKLVNSVGEWMDSYVEAERKTTIGRLGRLFFGE